MANVTVSNTATKIISANNSRHSFIIVNTGANTVYIGEDAAVTTSNGVPLLQDASLTEDNGGDRLYLGDIYGIVASGTSDVRYWERTR
jgi:hypothetical protein